MSSCFPATLLEMEIELMGVVLTLKGKIDLEE
jgi:hypothetical protein